jgi:hypothetical protein
MLLSLLAFLLNRALALPPFTTGFPPPTSITTASPTSCTTATADGNALYCLTANLDLTNTAVSNSIYTFCATNNNATLPSDASEAVIAGTSHFPIPTLIPCH